MAWYEFDNDCLIAKFPTFHNDISDGWTPCENPTAYYWIEFDVSGLADNKGYYEFKPRYSYKLNVVDDFSPIGSARIVGRLVLSDSAEAKYPKDADWLIWEKSPDASRLCKMEKGKWSTCPDMPVQKPPQLIVTDDDHGVVLLIYSFGIDQSDVEGSLRKVAKMLEDRGFPLKPRQAKPALEKKENDAASSQTNTPPPVATALRPPVAHRPNTNRVNGVQNHVTATVTKPKFQRAIMPQNAS